MSQKIVGVLRLRNFFAPRRSCFAQDDGLRVKIILVYPFLHINRTLAAQTVTPQAPAIHDAGGKNIHKILGGNLLRVFGEVDRVSREMQTEASRTSTSQ